MRFAQVALGWTPAEFWSATMYEFETAVLALERQHRPEPLSEDQVRNLFERSAAVTA